jgi:hypothetical protein
MPEGCEDVQTLSELVARKKQLEKLKAEAPRAGSTADMEKDKKESSQPV